MTLIDKKGKTGRPDMEVDEVKFYPAPDAGFPEYMLVYSGQPEKYYLCRKCQEEEINPDTAEPYVDFGDSFSTLDDGRQHGYVIVIDLFTCSEAEALLKADYAVESYHRAFRQMRAMAEKVEGEEE